MNKILKQGFAFFAISGCGWLIDFSLFTILTGLLNFSVMHANVMSSIPAITFVFFTSTRRTFINKSHIKLRCKYLIYFAYQAILIVGISVFGQLLFEILITSPISTIAIVETHAELAVKITITPITMTCNYVVMKALLERL
jgi:putative flippase GtrA